jgi:hypothetical protein
MSAEKFKRSFVKYANLMTSPGKVWRYQPYKTSIILSVIIPTLDANRSGYFLKLLTQISYQDFQQFEIIVVRGDPRQGRAINIAASFAKGKYLLTLDDDTSLPDPMTFCKLVEVMTSHPEIGIAGGNNVAPADAKLFVRRVMQELPRRSWAPGIPQIEQTGGRCSRGNLSPLATGQFKQIVTAILPQRPSSRLHKPILSAMGDRNTARAWPIQS